jgi:hypothetical protein
MAGLALILGLISATHAREVTLEEARRVAENQVAAVTGERGAWGQHEGATLGGVTRWMEEERFLGYLFAVEPTGFILVNPLRELAPVRIFSWSGPLDPEQQRGLTDVVRTFQQNALAAVEKELGRRPDPDEDLSHLMPRSFEPVWQRLLDPDFQPPPRQRRDVPGAGINYQEGEILLETTWSQEPPYNDMCPDHNCQWEGYGYYNNNCYTGCVATAGAQICRYWNWPPEGTGGPGYDVTYDWPNMGECYRWNDQAQTMVVLWDGNWRPATQAEIDAVALIMRKVGVGVNTEYHCDVSLAETDDLVWALPDYFRYSSFGIGVNERFDLGDEDFIQRILDNLNNNRPVVYKITKSNFDGHAFVVDGWDEVEGVYYFHLRYGWNGSNDGWFTIDGIPNSDLWYYEYIVSGIRPSGSIGGVMIGEYDPPAYPYRYFDKDASGMTADFRPGHIFQVLRSGLKIRSVSPDTVVGTVRFSGAPGAETSFFLEGDSVEKTRIRLYDGTIEFLPDGEMVIY